MTKKHFIALADAIRAAKPDYHSRHSELNPEYQEGFQNGRSAEWDDFISRMADFCQSQNPRFNRDRWIKYIEGK